MSENDTVEIRAKNVTIIKERETQTLKQAIRGYGILSAILLGSSFVGRGLELAENMTDGNRLTNLFSGLAESVITIPLDIFNLALFMGPYAAVHGLCRKNNVSPFITVFGALAAAATATGLKEYFLPGVTAPSIPFIW